MKWFKKKPEEKELKSVLPPEHQASIEIVAHKNASHNVKSQADEANAHLKELLEDNHFTLKIYLAAGGKPKARKQS